MCCKFPTYGRVEILRQIGQATTCMIRLNVSITISKSPLPSLSLRSPGSQLENATRAVPPFPGETYTLRGSLRALMSFEELFGSYRADPSRARKSTMLRGTTYSSAWRVLSWVLVSWFPSGTGKLALSTSYHGAPPPSSLVDIHALIRLAKSTCRRIISSYPLRPSEYKAQNIGRPRNRREFSIPIFKGDGMLVTSGGKSK